MSRDRPRQSIHISLPASTAKLNFEAWSFFCFFFLHQAEIIQSVSFLSLVTNCIPEELHTLFKKKELAKWILLSQIKAHPSNTHLSSHKSFTNRRQNPH